MSKMSTSNFTKEDFLNSRSIIYTQGELEALKIGQMLPNSQKRFLAKDWAAMNKLWEYKELRNFVESAQLLDLTGIEATRVLEDSCKNAPHVQESVHAKIRRADKDFTFASTESDHGGTHESAVDRVSLMPCSRPKS